MWISILWYTHQFVFAFLSVCVCRFTYTKDMCGSQRTVSSVGSHILPCFEASLLFTTAYAKLTGHELPGINMSVFPLATDGDDRCVLHLALHGFWAYDPGLQPWGSGAFFTVPSSKPQPGFIFVSCVYFLPCNHIFHDFWNITLS